jgi:alpha-tubulin suppressor-like RCC1 family protein
LEPELNDELEFMRAENPADKTVVKIDTADEYTGALMADGSLFTWGKNDRGQMGLGSGIGIDMVESENIPREVPLIEEGANVQHYVKNFHCGQNTMLF